MAEASSIRASVGRFVRGLLLLTGTVVFAVGVLIVFVPSVERRLPIAAVVEALGSDYVVLAVVGASAVVLAALIAAVQVASDTEEARLPVVEAVESAPHPGRAFDREFGGSTVRPPEAVREHLREVAVETVVRAEGCSRATAERRVAEGSWTDGSVAATYVAGERAGPRDVLRAVLGTDSRPRRTMEALERVAADGRGGVDTDARGDATSERLDGDGGRDGEPGGP